MLPKELVAWLREPCQCFLATTMADGSPQVTQVWADTDGERVLINIVAGSVKHRNIERDPRVAVAVADPNDPSNFAQVRGRVVEMTSDGGVEQIERFSRKYLGRSYPWYGGRDQTRVRLAIEADSISRRG